MTDIEKIKDLMKEGQTLIDEYIAKNDFEQAQEICHWMTLLCIAVTKKIIIKEKNERRKGQK